jgi:TrmH family RNA methyltransferase
MSASRNWRGVAEEIRRASTRRGRGTIVRCVIEGHRLHERALRSGTRIAAVLVAQSCSRRDEARTRDLLRELEATVPSFHVVPDGLVTELTEGRGGPGLVGLVELPKPTTLSRLVSSPNPAGQVFLVGCDIEDPGNVGAVVRTALASGAAALIGVGLTDPWHPKSVRTSMGSVFKLPLVAFESLQTLLPELESLRARTLAAVSTTGIPLDRIVFDRRPTAILLGSESFGLPDDCLDRVPELVSIPMVPGVDSYSVNAAAAMLLYEHSRQARSDARR